MSESFRRLDLPARNARYARTLAWMAFASILLSIGFIGLIFLIDLRMFIGAAAAAILSLPLGVAAMVFHHRCLSPRPVGPPLALIAGICLCAMYWYLYVVVASVATMHS